MKLSIPIPIWAPLNGYSLGDIQGMGLEAVEGRDGNVYGLVGYITSTGGGE